MRAAMLCCLLLVAAVASLAQRGGPGAGIAAGAQLYRANCAVCHGGSGDSVAGVDLWSGKFRRASSEADLMRIMRNGIPDTAMPPANLTEVQAARIAAYLRSEAAEAARIASLPGNAVSGKATFEGKGGCLRCHRVGSNGSRVGPNLTDIGRQRRSPDDLERSILDPSAEILPQNRFVSTVTSSGEVVSGRLLNHDFHSVQLIDLTEQLRSLRKSELREFRFAESSPMPSFRGKLSPDEIADLVVYLATLKGTGP